MVTVNTIEIKLGEAKGSGKKKKNLWIIFILLDQEISKKIQGRAVEENIDN